MALRGLTPIPPYSDVNSPWESICGNCGGITFPTLTSVKKALKQGQPKCCDLCRRNGPIRPEQAEDMLRLAGGEPLVPFPGVKARWRARCLNEWCRQTIEPWFDSIKHAGTGACWHCSGYGIKADDDALVYLMTHEPYQAAKIGIAKVGSRRIALHESTAGCWSPPYRCPAMSPVRWNDGSSTAGPRRGCRTASGHRSCPTRDTPRR